MFTSGELPYADICISVFIKQQRSSILNPMTICEWLEEASFLWLLRLKPNKHNRKPGFISFSDLKKKQKALNSWSVSKMTSLLHFGKKRNWERNFQEKISQANYFFENVEIILLRKSNTKKLKFPEIALDTSWCVLSEFSSFFFLKSLKKAILKTFYSLLEIFGLLNWIFFAVVAGNRPILCTCSTFSLNLFTIVCAKNTWSFNFMEYITSTQCESQLSAHLLYIYNGFHSISVL